MVETYIKGLVIKAQSGFSTVETGEGLVICQLRGKLKKGKATGDIAAVGDRVHISRLADGSGAIEEVEERKSAIVRLDPRPQGNYQQVLLANPDQAVFVFACAHPNPNLRMLDRFLVIAEKQRVPAVIVANKTDLVERPNEIFGIYEPLGYPVLYTSTTNNKGVDELKTRLIGKISAAMDKGKHTTVVRQLFALKGGGYLADTPGWKSLALWDTEPEEIDAYFPELARLVANCQFSDCSHQHEPGCAVIEALKGGRINPERYDSYIRLRAGQE